MNLPAGLRMETACVLIAFRELFDDPNWYDAGIVDNMRTSGDGSYIDSPYYDCKRLGLYVPDEYTMPMQNANEPHLIMHVEGNRVRIPRNSRCIWFYKTDTGNHAVCTTATLFGASFAKFNPWFVGFHKWGMIVDELGMH